ncbi:MAG: hypothetical protein HS126_37160 [Anaerolineales bacterium]|nr:hypothetical protein [Anaerolineales bacterium]
MSAGRSGVLNSSLIPGWRRAGQADSGFASLALGALLAVDPASEIVPGAFALGQGLHLAQCCPCNFSAEIGSIRSGAANGFTCFGRLI